jgi:hypothetical protein
MRCFTYFPFVSQQAVSSPQASRLCHSAAERRCHTIGILVGLAQYDLVLALLPRDAPMNLLKELYSKILDVDLENSPLCLLYDTNSEANAQFIVCEHRLEPSCTVRNRNSWSRPRGTIKIHHARRAMHNNPISS